MMRRTNLDSDALRTLVISQQLGSFNRAAIQIGRSQSAVTQQMHKLEEQAGERLFRKHGRGLALTAAGDVMLAYARRILELNDEAVSAVRGRAIEGAVRFGLPADFAEAWLPTALGRFKRAHPAARIEAVVDRNRGLLERLDRGELDLVLALNNAERNDAQLVGSLPLVWIGPASAERVWTMGEPVPLAVFEPPCFFRAGALAALDQAGVAWHISFVSPGLGGLWAAVEAGLGVTLRTAVGLPRGVRILDDDAGLPAPPETALGLCFHDGQRPQDPALRQLRSIIVETLEENLAIYRSAKTA